VCACHCLPAQVDLVFYLGSIAAGWQAAIGNVAAGSLFAGLQSLGAVGLNAGVAAAIGGGAAAGTALGTELDTNVRIVNL